MSYANGADSQHRTMPKIEHESIDIEAAPTTSTAAGKDKASASSIDSRKDFTLAQRINLAINGTIEKGFDSLGRFIARRPILTIVLSLIVFGGFTSGVIRLNNETRGDKLWLPSGTQAEKDSEIVEDYYPAFALFENVFVQYEDGSTSVLTPEAFDRAYDLHLKSVNQTFWLNAQTEDDRSSPKEVGWLPQEVHYKDLCLSRASSRGAETYQQCRATNILAIFGYEPTNWSTQAKILTLINDQGSWDRSLLGFDTQLESLLGGLQYDGARVTGANALSLTYVLAANQTYEDEEEEDPATQGWEKAWLDMIEALDEADEAFQYPRIATRSFSDEFGSTIDNDVLLLQVAIVAIAVYTCIAISRFNRGCAGSRVALTIAGLLSIGFAVGSCYGLGGYIGIVFSPLMTVLPFIMIGVGVDGMFVLADALDQTDPNDSMENRMAQTMRQAGVSVTVASLTNFCAFMIGSNTSLPALSAFSVFAAFGLLFDLVYQVTFFAAVMSIDMARQDRNALDVLCCVKSCEEPEAGCCYGICGRGFPKTRLSTKLMRFLGGMLKTNVYRVVVLVLWAVILAIGITGTARMKVEADVNDFIPEGSYLKDYVDLAQEQFTETGNTAALYFLSTNEVPLDFATPLIQGQMDESIELLKQNEWILPDSIDAWWDAFKRYQASQNATVTQATFWADLDAFLNAPPGRFYYGSIVFQEGHTAAAPVGIKTCRFGFTFKYIEETLDIVESMDDSRDTAESVPEPLGTNAFTYGSTFLQSEQYKSIGGEALLNLGLGILMIAIVILFLLANIVASVITFFCVVAAIIELVGIMNFLGFYIDSVTVIFLVISLGLAVDYSVHVAHAFLANREPDINLRLEQTMTETGAAVINGACSTLIAALCLAGSGSYVFITFFAALLTIVICGAFSGLFVLPVLLSIFKPAPHVVV